MLFKLNFNAMNKFEFHNMLFKLNFNAMNIDIKKYKGN